jgi:hypothetical protein
VCVILCTMFCLIVVLFCVKCVVCVLCLIVVPRPPGENQFAVKINNKQIIIKITQFSALRIYGDFGEICLIHLQV